LLALGHERGARRRSVAGQTSWLSSTRVQRRCLRVLDVGADCTDDCYGRLARNGRWNLKFAVTRFDISNVLKSARLSDIGYDARPPIFWALPTEA
jgi:hypothetical protein